MFDFVASFGVARDEEEAAVDVLVERFFENFEQACFLAGPGGGAHEDERAIIIVGDEAHFVN